MATERLRLNTDRSAMLRAMKKKGLSIKALSGRTGASPGLIRLVVEGSVTHPNIALRIGKALDLTEAQIRQMMPERYWEAELPLLPMEGIRGEGG